MEGLHGQEAPVHPATYRPRIDRYREPAAIRQRSDRPAAVGITKNQKAYYPDVRFVPMVGRACKAVPDHEPREAALATLLWRRAAWHHGMKGGWRLGLPPRACA